MEIRVTKVSKALKDSEVTPAMKDCRERLDRRVILAYQLTFHWMVSRETLVSMLQLLVTVKCECTHEVPTQHSCPFSVEIIA